MLLLSAIRRVKITVGRSLNPKLACGAHWWDPFARALNPHPAPCADLQIVNLLTTLVDQHGEGAVFTGNVSFQVVASTSYGQIGRNVTDLASAKAALLGIADQGGGCPVAGHAWPAVSNISAGPLGGGVSHAARYEEILMGQEYKLTDALGKPTGPKRAIDWGNVSRFAPNPALDDFAPEQCIAGGSWVVRNASFFVKQVW